ncbi:MAG: amino acid adenylation domain-containing protein [Acidobacteria bacterium]|jgi:fengycin family lipopeptide synthetase D|nr:amino acid adenylation domain-containing protein [Acidobacteriota bacterium]
MIKEKDFTRKMEVAANKNVKERDYWLAKLSGELAKSHIYYDFRKSAGENTIDKLPIEIPAELSGNLNKLSGGSHHKLHMILAAGLVLLLHKYTGNNDIIIGTPIYKQDIQGEFVNTVLALRNTATGTMTFKDLLLSVRQTLFDAVENQNYPIESLIFQLKLPVEENEFPLFDIVILLENIHEKDYLRHVQPRMYFIFAENTGVISGAIEYHSGYYKQATVERAANLYLSLLGQALAGVNLRLSELDIFTEDDKKWLANALDHTDVSWPRDKTITGLFAEQVEKYPGKTAVVCGQESLTYRQLDDKANRIANYLHLEKQSQPDQLTGLLLDKSIDCIASILGIIKAGGGYVPIDPNLPEERIIEIIEDADIEVLISEKKYIKTLNRLQWQCPGLHTFLCLDSRAVDDEEEPESALMDKKLWEYVGESAVDDITGGGWKSSYTGQAISQEEMAEYAQNALAKVSPFLNTGCRVLEIGCATGLTMYLAAPKAGFYYGTDLSPVIIERNRERVEREGHTNIKLECLPAHEIDKINEQNFDLIIMNSVIQHFSGHNYLRKVIAQAIQLLAPQGVIFIGDIMDLEQKQTLINDLVQFKKNNPDKTYRTKTDWSEELFIGQSFFHDLEAENPAISSITFSPKIRTIENELTKFRYDALLTIDKNRENRADKKKKLKYREDLHTLEKYSCENPRVPVAPHHLLYIIYTSGTTGKPKGVMIEHRNVVRLMMNDRNLFDFNERDVWTMFHAYNFDFSVWEMYGALLHGGKLIIIPRETARDTGEYLKILAGHEVTVLNQTPAAFYRLIEEEMDRTDILLKLRYIIFGGEALAPAKLKSWLQKYPQTKIINMYGITETTVHVTYKEIGLAEIENDSRSIGTPIPTLSAVVLGNEGQLLPVGAPGELYVGGAGVARGYLNRPELSAEKFRPLITLMTLMSLMKNKKNKSFAGVKGGLFQKPAPFAYKTGDRVRVLNTGELEYLGRVDQQVKIRGFRIELGEIESHIRKHEAVKDAAVIVRDDGYGDRYLCAYIVWDSHCCSNDVSELKEYLGRRVPEYMIPLHFVPVEKIPLTPNGKLDLKSLPEPTAAAPGADFIPPGSEIETKMAEIWADILHIDKAKISMAANFFELGGHSLKATVLIANLHKEFNVKVPLAEVFKTPTIKELAGFIAKSVETKFIPLVPAPEKEYYPLSSAQKRYYILQQMKAGDLSYNMPRVVELTGELDRRKIEEVFRKLIRRHESFRTAFQAIDGQTVQKIYPQVEFAVEYFEVVEAKAQDIIQRFIRVFDLSHPPLLRVGIIQLKDAADRQILMLDMNHIISDGISFNLFLTEFMAFYRGDEMPELKLQYKDFAEWQSNLIRSGQMEKQEIYWLERFKGEIPVLRLPVDFPGRTVQSTGGGNIYYTMDRTLTAAVNQMTLETGATLNMILLTVYNILLWRYTGQEDIVVGSLTTGRNHADLQNIIGLFLNSLALRNYPNENKTFSGFLNEVKENTINDYANQDYQYDDLVARLGITREGGRSGLFDTLFTCQNLEKPGINIPGLTLKPYLFKHDTAKFDLYFDAIVADDTFDIVMKYSTERFLKLTIEKIIKHFVEILEQVTQNRQIKLKDIQVSIELAPIAENRFLEEDEDFGID